MIVKLLTEHHLEFLSIKGGCTGSLESTLVKMPHCWKRRVTAHFYTVSRVRIYMIPTAAYDLSILINGHQYTGRIFL